MSRSPDPRSAPRGGERRARRARACLRALVAATGGALCAAGRPCDAQSSAGPRPIAQGALAGDLVFPQERGELQLDLVVHVGRWTPAGTAAPLGRALPVELGLEYGLTGAWQLEAEVETAGRPGARAALAELRLGVRRSWLTRRPSGWSFATGVSVARTDGADDDDDAAGEADASHAAAGRPAGSGDAADDEGGARVAVTPSLVLGRNVPGLGGTHAFARAGVRLSPRPAGARTGAPGGGPEGVASWAVGALVPVGPLRVDAEWVATSRLGRERRASSAVLLGLVWPTPLGWELAVGAPLGLRGHAADVAVARLTAEF